MLRRLRGDKKGAVLAEFVIAIVPVMMTFFSFVQLSRIATARLVVKHSAIVGARAASVLSNQHDNNPGASGDGQADVKSAVQAALGPWSRAMTVNVTVNDQSSTADPYGWVEVKVSATYRCNIPMGHIACGLSATKTLEETYKMPHQGATYKM